MPDLRYAFRQLARSPGFTAVALLTLTLGMGANTAFFSVLYGVVLRQPPYPRAERLVTVYNVWSKEVGNGGRLSPAEFHDYQERQRAFEGVAASDLGRMTLTSPGTRNAFADRVKVSRVTPNLFPVLGVVPARGRGIRTGDEHRGSIAVLSHELWQSQFGGAADVLDRTIRLNGMEHEIVGVMPAGFAYPEPDMGAWMPIDLTPRGEPDRTDHYLAVVGRLAAGMSAGDARLDLQRVARELQHDAPGAYPTDARWTIGAESLRQTLFGRMLLPLGLLMAAASSFLLIACVNVAIMSLLRAVSRRREISIRLAVGATRRDIVRQLAVEAGVVCGLGALGGLVLARVALALLKAFAPGDIPRLQELGIDVPTALFTSVVLVLVTALVGLAPALAAVRMKAFDGSIPTGRSSDGRPTTRLRDALTVMEIAIAVSLLVCTGLTVRSLHALVRVDLGFATEHRFAFKTNLTEHDYPDAARAERFYEQLTTRLEALPGILSIGAISYLPLSGEGHAVSAAPTHTSGEPDAPAITAGWGIVRGRYFETMGVRLLRGRLFSADDRASSPARRHRRRGARAAPVGERRRCGRPAGPAWHRADGRDANGGRRGPPRQPSWAQQGVAADGLRAALAVLPARDVHRDQDHERAGGARARNQSGAGVRGRVGTYVLRPDGGRAIRRGARPAALHGRPGQRVLLAGTPARGRRDLRRDRLRRRAAHARVRHPPRARRAAGARRRAGPRSGRRA